MKSLLVALSMYSKLPVPQVEWDDNSLKGALCCFPAVGVIIGAVLLVWWRLAEFLSCSPLLTGAVSLLIPIALSGAIHLDGFCDTCDALSSHQSRERKLEILKDSHTGAFAIICCALYLIFFFALWCEASPAGRGRWVLALTPVLSRSLSGLFAVTVPNARGTGLLASFTAPMDLRRARAVLTVWTVLSAAGMLLASPFLGVFTLAGAALAVLYYLTMAKKQFGGVTGDLAGFFLQVCECAAVLLFVVGQKVGGLL